MLSALVVGSTDATSVQVISELLKSGNFDRVTIIARKEINYQGQNKDHLIQHIVEIDKLEEHKELFKDYTHMFSCSENVGRINNETQNIENSDQDYIINASKIFKEVNSNKNLHFIYLSSSNNERVDEELKSLKFSRLTIFKPAYITEKAPDVIASNVITPIVDEVSTIPIVTLAKALVNIIQLPPQGYNDNNNNSNVIEYINNKDAYLIAKCCNPEDSDIGSTSSLSLTLYSKDYRNSRMKDEKYNSINTGTENPIKTRKRYYTADNIRCFLMFLVVFGHLIESFDGPVRRDIYVFIYIFHMPFFIFLSGWFARFNPKKILRHLVFTYVVFQCIYIGTDMALNYTEGLAFSISTPYWTLWYLFSLVGYYLLIPFFTTNNKKDAFIFIGCSCIIVPLSYVIENFDRYLSISRSISFFPYFIAGYYFSQIFKPGSIIDINKNLKLKWSGFLIPVFILTQTLLIILNVPDNSIYRISPEKNWKFSLVVPIIMAMCNMAFIPLSLFWVPNKKIPIITSLGQNTLPIYIFHVGIVLVAKITKVFRFAESINILISFGISVFTMILLGNHYLANVFKKIF
ncbi:hypothetical protein BCR32DRAFT_276498 [Anaeromyces robustus]|uniref:Acyltransferase 3 domain-containing protein n=1 Tax=Anaeromyces robustus TaxID=1754192 RepID=A0A1Y1XHH7_9FUNG|nr:hypothetical protein BCR32DRAFT_276498 [Anaeromyces robustus]|eukprot:ORX85200.1 hypothetical protein BCR32DRAFT_276498 [Anaeromyces robustus]